MGETAAEGIEMDGGDGGDAKVTVRAPKRVLHFSDGTIEEFSEDEADADADPAGPPAVDTSAMAWGPWLLHKTAQTGSTVLSACDQVGESLASFLGITSPKYYFEVDEARRAEAEGSLQRQPADDVATQQPLNHPQ